MLYLSLSLDHSLRPEGFVHAAVYPNLDLCIHFSSFNALVLVSLSAWLFLNLRYWYTILVCFWPEFPFA